MEVVVNESKHVLYIVWKMYYIIGCKDVLKNRFHSSV